MPSHDSSIRDSARLSSKDAAQYDTAFMMTFKTLTRRREIGANSYLLETERHRFIIDSGMHPKESGLNALPDFNQVPRDKLDAIFISHAHHDHIGSLPVLQNRHPNTPVIMTEATGDLSSAMLHNSVNVMTSQRDELGILEYPLFTHSELDEIRVQWMHEPLRKPFMVAGSDVECTFYDAGHIMGSVGMRFKTEDKTVFYTGDVNFEAQTIAREADFPMESPDALIMETTRGDYQRPEGFTRRAEKERLATLIRETYAQGGAVLIPVFALGKSQELLVMIHELRQMDLIPEMPVIIGGLSAKVTVLYDHYSSESRRNYEGFRILHDMSSLVAPRKKRKEITSNPRTIYALSSGMMSEGTTSNRFAMRFLDNPRNAVAFVGYTDPTTPGWKLRHAKPGDMIELDPKMPPVELRARVESFDFSAHASREQLVDYACAVKPKKILLVHGDEAAQAWFSQTLATALPGTEVLSPMPGQRVNLW